MDESEFAMGESQTTRALINIRENSNWKIINGRQEWITAIECVSAPGVALPPRFIFIAKNTNTAWILEDTPSDWRFSTRMSGWTSDSHWYGWLTGGLEPTTRPEDQSLRKLFVVDGHSSHITADVIAFCVEHAIDLAILPPHTSHMLQPHGVSMFQPLKRALAKETGAAARLEHGRVPLLEWSSTYIRAREIALKQGNILSGWKATGLQPMSPIEVHDKLAVPHTPQPRPPRLPSQTSSLDKSLLNSSPPSGTGIGEANAVLNYGVQMAGNVASPTRRYVQRMTWAVEASQSELTKLGKELKDAKELLQTRRKGRESKRVALQGKFVFTIKEIIQLPRQAEEDNKERSHVGG